MTNLREPNAREALADKIEARIKDRIYDGLSSNERQIILVALRQPAAPRGPVAWRWKPKQSTLWIYNPEAEWLAKQSLDTIDVEPLYTSPPPSDERAKVRQAAFQECIAIARRYDDCGASFIIEKIQEAALSPTNAPAAEAQTVSSEMTGNERFLLGWLHDEAGQYGECQGPSLDALVARGFVVIGDEESGVNNGFIAKGRDIMYRSVSITDAGRAALAAPKASQRTDAPAAEGGR